MMKRRLSARSSSRGFALVVTISLLVLLMVIGTGLLTLSALTLRGTQRGSAQAEARANARLALLLAIGELQKEMGPDMRVSAESALFDNDQDTESIDGVDQSRWLASYNSWGNWLNAEYRPPDGGGTLRIQDTYTPRREAMFRRWLLSLPKEMSEMADAPRSLSGWDDSNSVVLVGPGSLGEAAARHPDQITRAWLLPVGETGKQAWWIGPENHRAKITLAKQPRSLAADEWETSHGDTAEAGIGALAGFEALDDDAEASDKLISRLTLGAAGIETENVHDHFFDLTATSRGVIASVRSGHLKKDLSLLFEQPQSRLPAPYRFNSNHVREPSIRPMSTDLSAKRPQTPGRHFASWTGMRHFYRMYRRDSDAQSPSSDGGGTGGAPALNWAGSKPWTDFVGTTNCFSGSSTDWDGRDSYLRIPVLAKLTFIHSLMTVPNGQSNGQDRYELYLVYTPVYTYWNPYNTELRIPNNTLALLSSAYKILPIRGRLFLNGAVAHTEEPGKPPGFNISVRNTWSKLQSGSGGDIVFKPGELRLFSHDTITGGIFGTEMFPGFDPQAYGGQKVRITAPGKNLFTQGDDPALEILFGHSTWGGNVNCGNTPGSLNVVQDWESNSKRMALCYQIDWFQVKDDQTYTRITVPGEPPPWAFDNQPLPVAYTQLTMKGLSEYDYESINWARDWRCRNWLHSPPSYFGHGLYMSEDDTIANTQRINNPYVMNFGPMAMAEMPKVVFHNGPSAFLGSGSAPFEKVNAAPSLELPSAPIGSLAGFAGMRIKPGWTEFTAINGNWTEAGGSWHSTSDRSFVGAEAKALAYQSGITGPGIGNSFLHPIIPRTDVYRFFNNSISMDPIDRRYPEMGYDPTDTKAFCDFWDHTFLLNDALWDDYFVSSLADQTRPSAGAALNLRKNLERLVEGETLANSRYQHYADGSSAAEIKSELEASDGYLKAAAHLMVDGMFNVNSTSVPAWHALFAGIRERKVAYRDDSGRLGEVGVPSGKRIAISRFNTAVSDQEMDDPEYGARLDGGHQGWTGVRFLDDEQLLRLAEECVRQVKLRGPFLNFSEFINRRLSDDELGLMGALQSAIDYDDNSPESESINYRFKNGPDFMLENSDLSSHDFATPEAALGSRFAGIPGYVIQSDLLKPIANTLSVRDDTFRIRAYGEANDKNGRVTARAWCEAIVQRVPEYYDATNNPDVPARLMNAGGTFSDNAALSDDNRRFGRRFRIESFRWLSSSEI